ncbi:MAG: glycine--tRNA ligase, partial [Clostridiales bacterium]|nr:glycine--tRNA ligase [Clostridiales bacterium]
MLKNSEKSMDKLVALCKGRGFVYAGSEIYGGLANSWDYGPLGVELKNNIKRAWWKKFVQENPYNVGLDSAILMNPQVWAASGHVETFNDPLIDCKNCRMRHRADKLVEEWHAARNITDVAVEVMNNGQLVDYIKEKGIACPQCGKTEFTDIRKFNLMFKTFQGVTEDTA